jgi:hypothetical protein
MMKADWSQRAQNRTICTQVCASLTQCVGRPYSAIRTHGRAAGGLGEQCQDGPGGYPSAPFLREAVEAGWKIGCNARSAPFALYS